ncbi:MAG TPA: LON peptidase substrate-binding domain-containing protein [Ignavibacteriaceae bacterium]|nr:LON peptidase substrate-binding domain-containing protein [Ignavibacteriaceae bacterium]
MKKIPLFPLQLVVFPNSRYPLHIFEERYRKLLQKCLAESSGFIIVSKFKTRISDVGVFVKVSEVIKKYDTGESDIIVKGIKRYLIGDVSMNPDGYLEATVEDYEDDDPGTDFSLLEKMKEKFEEILNKANFHLDESFWKRFKESETKSFKVAEKSGLTLEQQQELLILKEENLRLSYLIEYFNKLNEHISESSFLKQIVMSDGYLNKE